MNFIHVLFSTFSRTLNIIAAILLLVAGLAAYINPKILWPLGFFGLAYPYIVILNVFFIISWIIRKRSFFLVSLIAILLTYPQLKVQYVFPYSKTSTLERDLRVMNYNVRNFDLYNWSKDSKARMSMMDTIQLYDPDILMIQEYYTNKRKFKNKEYLESIGYRYHSVAVELIKDQDQLWGVAIFSKYPIIESGKFLKGTHPSPYGKFYDRGVYADIEINGLTIRAISAHLQSIHFAEDDYETIKELKSNSNSNLNKLVNIAKKLKLGFILRGQQVEELKDTIAASPYPVILGADFNDTPSSYAYQQINRKLDDTFLQKGKRIGSTYNGIIPFLRIDFIFKDPSIECTNFILNKNPYSDHFPIIADFKLPLQDN